MAPIYHFLSLFIIMKWSIPRKLQKIQLRPKITFFCLEKIYQMMPISIHLTKVENSGPDWSGQVVQVASGLQKLMQSARRDIGDLKRTVA